MTLVDRNYAGLLAEYFERYAFFFFTTADAKVKVLFLKHICVVSHIGYFVLHCVCEID